MKRNSFMKWFLMLAATAGLFATSCRLPNLYSDNLDAIINKYKTGNIPIVRSTQTVTIGWDNYSGSVEVEYRPRFTQKWKPLGSGKDSFPVSGLAPGTYEFAIVYGNPPKTLSSLDKTAQPSAGWFLMYRETPQADTNGDGNISRGELENFVNAWKRGEYTNNQLSVNIDYYLGHE